MKLDNSLAGFYLSNSDNKNECNIFASDVIGLDVKIKYSPTFEVEVDGKKFNSFLLNKKINQAVLNEDAVRKANYYLKLTIKNSDLRSFAVKHRIDLNEEVFNHFIRYNLFEIKNYDIIEDLSLVADYRKIIDRGWQVFFNYTEVFNVSITRSSNIVYADESNPEHIHREIVNHGYLSSGIIQSGWLKGKSKGIKEIKYANELHEAEIKGFKTSISFFNEHIPVAIIEDFDYEHTNEQGKKEHNKINKINFSSVFMLEHSGKAVGDKIKFQIDPIKNAGYSHIDKIAKKPIVVDYNTNCPYCDTVLTRSVTSIKCDNNFCSNSGISPILNIIDTKFNAHDLEPIVCDWLSHFPHADSTTEISSLIELFTTFWYTGIKGTSSRFDTLKELFGIENAKILSRVEEYIENRFLPTGSNFGFTLKEFIKICSFSHNITQNEIDEIASKSKNVLDIFNGTADFNIRQLIKDSILDKVEICDILVDVIPLKGFNENEYIRRHQQFFRIFGSRNDRSAGNDRPQTG